MPLLMLAACCLIAFLTTWAWHCANKLQIQSNEAVVRPGRVDIAILWVTGLALSLICSLQFTDPSMALAAITFCITLLVLGIIDTRTGFLPNRLSVPLMALGLAVNLGTGPTMFSDAVSGAVAGYMVLWIVNALFRLGTGRHGLGGGDMTLLAAIGAWLGWQALPLVLLLASSAALFMALTLFLAGKFQRNQAVRFGPFLAGGACVALLWR